MANINNRVKLWRGTRAKYNAIATNGTYDYWTEYYVLEPNYTWKVYFGTKEVSVSTGELAPVKSIVTAAELAEKDKSQGSRYLVGSGNVYYVVEFGPTPGVEAAKIDPLGNYSVRVEDEDFKRYQLVGGALITYDHSLDHDCGVY